MFSSFCERDNPTSSSLAMRSDISFAVLLALARTASAQQTPYGQCGGSGWTGPTTCTAGWHCEKANDCKSLHKFLVSNI